MTCSETERQFYLAMAGVQVWYARAPLPGAAPSPAFDFPAPAAAAEPVGPLPVAPSAPAPSESRGRGSVDAGQAGERIARLQSLMAGNRPVTEPADPAHSPAESVPGAATAEELPAEDHSALEVPVTEAGTPANLRVTLGFWATGNLMLVSGVSEDASERLQDTLANNILAALGQSGQVTPTILRWPVFANPLVPGNSFADFSRLLTSMAGDREDRRLVLLGVLPDDLSEERGSWLARTVGAPAVDFPHTLAELAAVPAYKRALWSELKPLVQGRA